MPKKHITINELGNIEVNYKNGVSALECSKSMKLGKDKIYRYYKEFSTGKTVMLIYENYISNKKKCGRKVIELSESYLRAINEKLDMDWSLDAISGRDKLDKIEEGSLEWKNVISEFYEEFKKELDVAEKEMSEIELEEEVTDIPCEKCGKFMVVKFGRYGKFLACPGYPDCKNIKKIPKK